MEPNNIACAKQTYFSPTEVWILLEEVKKNQNVLFGRFDGGIKIT
jgi:hypothetical protein